MTFAKQHIRNILISKGVAKQGNESTVVTCEITSEESFNEKLKAQKDKIKRMTEKNKELKNEFEII